ncbi:hypothetical protein Fcan01_11406 [Folsomia candida]|uniref:Uncharacterized protein n=1 Tax=Folsomia candida TaxID=158441 RepID=A0A226E9Q2_FOLCA|nr:hypothetical protein Fcan01_11406 [Folsomia candida]
MLARHKFITIYLLAVFSQMTYCLPLNLFHFFGNCFSYLKTFHSDSYNNDVVTSISHSIPDNPRVYESDERLRRNMSMKIKTIYDIRNYCSLIIVIDKAISRHIYKYPHFLDNNPFLYYRNSNLVTVTKKPVVYIFPNYLKWSARVFFLMVLSNYPKSLGYGRTHWFFLFYCHYCQKPLQRLSEELMEHVSKIQASTFKEGWRPLVIVGEGGKHSNFHDPYYRFPKPFCRDALWTLRK